MIDDFQPSDFFVVGGTLKREASSYVRRPADDELLRLTLAREYCNALTARQMGKSSLMIRTADRLQTQGVRVAIIDLSAIGSDVTVSEWYFGLVTRLTEQLGLAVDEQEWWQAHAESSPVQRFRVFLREVVLASISEPVVVFVDEIDSTLKLRFTDDFFAAIRAMYNARASEPVYQRLTFVLVGAARPADLIKDRRRTPYNIGVNVDLTDFQFDELVSFVPILERTHSGQGEEILRWVLDWTGGQPYLTQKLCAAVSEYVNGDAKLEQSNVDTMVERLFLADETRNESNLRAIRDRLLSSPYLARMVRVYKQVLDGKRVLNEERSLEQNELKLTGLIRTTKQGMLEVHNRVYSRVFDLTWAKANTPVSWSQRVAVATTIIAVLAIGVAGFLAIQQQTQTADIQAQTFIQSFQSTTSAEVRLDSLARLFGLGGQYVQQARDLFLSLSQQDRLALLSPQSPENVGSQLVTVIEGVYQYVSDTSDGNTLLATMVGELEQVSATGASSLATEITFWLQAREWAQAGRYEDAVDQYNDVINRSEKRGHLNITAQFERGVAHVDLGHYDAALADFEVVLTSDRDREAAVVEQILGEPPLAARWAGQSAQYPSLSAVLPTLTPTPLVINTHTPTPTVTSTATRTSTATPSLIATCRRPTVSPSPTPVPTVGGSPIVYGALTYGSGRQALTNGTTLYSGFLLYFTVRNISDRELTMNFRGLAIRDPTKPGDQRFINGINLFKGTLYPSEVVEIEVRLSSLSCSGCDLSCSDCDSFPSISASQWDPGSKVYVPEGWMPSSLRYRVTIQPATATPLPMGEITGVTLRGGRSHSILIDVTYSGVDTNATYSACILGTNYSATCPTSNFRPASNSGTFSLEALIDNSYCLGGAFKVENLMIALRRYDTYTGVLSSPITWTFPFEYTWCSGP